MATPDEILDDMKSYGVFDEQIIKPIEQPIYNQNEQPIEQPTYNQNEQPMDNQNQLNTQIQQPQMPQANTIKTIFCPNCGEVIRLD